MTSPTRISKKKMLIASVALLSIGLGGSAATGAYFTATKSVANNQLSSGTVVLGNIGADATAATETPVTITNLIPIEDSDVSTKARTFSVNVRNAGSASIDWVASFTTPNGVDNSFPLMFKYTTNNGSTWSSVYTADPLNTTKIPSTSSLAAGATQTVKFLVWLPSYAPSSAQGKSLTFSLNVNAIQAGVSQS